MFFFQVKKDYIDGLGDSFDLVPIGAWYGNGRKAGWSVSSFDFLSLLYLFIPGRKALYLLIYETELLASGIVLSSWHVIMLILKSFRVCAVSCLAFQIVSIWR